MPNQSKAIVLHSIKYGETSLIVNCFLYDIGVKTFIIKGVLNSKNKKFSKSYFLPLSIIYIDYFAKNNKDIGYIVEAKPAQIFTSLHVDIFKSSVIIFISELLNSVFKENPGSNKKLFEYLEYPNIKKESDKFFDLRLGTSSEVKPIENYIKDPELKKFKELLGTNFEDLNSMKIDNLLRVKMLGLMIDYYSLHLQMFKSPKSINIFNEVFK